MYDKRPSHPVCMSMVVSGHFPAAQLRPLTWFLCVMYDVMDPRGENLAHRTSVLHISCTHLFQGRHTLFPVTGHMQGSMSRKQGQPPENFLSFAGNLEIFAGHLIKFNCSFKPDILEFRQTCPANFGKPARESCAQWKLAQRKYRLYRGIYPNLYVRQDVIWKKNWHFWMSPSYICMLL